ncbi:MAG: hypothetical protein E2O50_00090 [Gammaproteobacteria bacterium]|nr:MAG: hypothetical protein E2O50_00090 [Gammaproteobacteria bacterium]
MSRVQDHSPELSAAQREWRDRNLAEQKQRHADIVEDMEQLAARRDEWIEAFLERIQTRGFNYNCDALRKILKEELPVKPDRPFKVVY